MSWLDAFNAAMKRRSRFDCQDDTQSCQQENAAIFRSARTTKLTPLPDVTQLLAKRAVTQCNRDREAVAAYLKTHAILAKGRSFNA
jgi:hypothetical protein